MSKRRERENRQRRKAMHAAFGPNPLCEIRWDGRCLRWADNVHELRKRSQGGSITDPSNCIPSCHPCNSAIEDHPTEAHARGFVIRTEDTHPADQ